MTTRRLRGARAAASAQLGLQLLGIPSGHPLDVSRGVALGDELEVYCFANCTTRMEYLVPAAHTPWIESYGNEFDIVARLGVLAPHPEQRGVKIDGPRYVHPGAWGHFLNAHYLYDVEREQKRGRKRGPKQRKATPFVLVNASDYPGAEVPRLYRYLNGGSPSDPPWAISSVRQSDRASARPDIPPPRTASEKPGSAGREGSGRPVTAGSCPAGATDAFDPSALDSYAGLRGGQGAGEDSSHAASEPTGPGDE